MTAPVLLARPLIVAGVAFLVGLSCALGHEAALGAALLAAAAVTVLLARARSLVALVPFVLAFFLAGALARSLTHRDAEVPRDAGAVEGWVSAAVARGVEEDVYVVDLAAIASGRTGPFVSCAGRAQVHVPRTPAADLPCGRAGDRVRFIGPVNPRPPGVEGPSGRPDVTLFLTSARACVRVKPREHRSVRLTLERFRDDVHAAIGRALEGDRGALVRAFATGDQSGLSRPVADDFRAAGLSHLVAVSGQNLAIVSGVFLVVLGALLRMIPSVALGFGVRRTAALVAAPCVVVYTLLVGGTPSAVRAAVMVLVLLAGHVLHQTREPLSALALALLVMLGLDPGTLFDPSFQLSFAAVLALFFVYPALATAFGLERRSTPVRLVLEVALASLAASLGTAPLSAAHFGSLSLVGLVANVPAHPLASLILVPLSLLGGLVGVISAPLARPILAVAGWAAGALMTLAHASASLPGASISLPPPSLLECALFAGALGLFAAREHLRRAPRLALILLAVLVLEVAGGAVGRLLSKTLRVTALDVGQGDAIVAELPGGRVLVVDTGPPGRHGPGASERVLIPFLRQRRIFSIDLLVLTHPHADHVGGFVPLTRAFDVRAVWWTGDRREGPAATLDAVAAHPGLERLVKGATRAVDLGAVRLERLAPLRAAGDEPIVNDGSIVLRLVYGARAILLAGDAEAAEESSMIARSRADLAADVLKLGHHGSRTSSSEAFLDAVRPRFAIVSAGRRNHFGFPHEEVMTRLERRGVRVLRTDVDGPIEVVTDGVALEARPVSGGGLRARGADTRGERGP